MPKEQPYELLTKPDLFRENANINNFIVVPLVMLEAAMDYMHATRDKLWPAERKQVLVETAEQFAVELSKLSTKEEYAAWLDVRAQQLMQSEHALLQLDEKPPITPMECILPSLSGWSRSEAMKGSEQLVRSFMGQPVGGTQEGMGQGPILTPPKPVGSPGAMAVVAYNGVKDLRRDIRRKRWSW